MFYARINKIRVFSNREGFSCLFNRAKMRIYSYAAALPHTAGDDPQVSPVRVGSSLLSDLAGLPDEATRRQKLQEAVEAEVNKFAQSAFLEINGVKDNQSLLFGDSGLVVYRSGAIPAWLDLQLWVIESDEDVRRFALDAGQVIDSDAFKSLFAIVEAALTAVSPVLSGAIATGSIVANLLRKKLLTNKDDLVGYWQATLNRAEHYPHGTRDKQGVPDTTGNIQVDYTLFGFENSIENGNRMENGELRMENDGSVMTDAAPDLSPGPSPVNSRFEDSKIQDSKQPPVSVTAAAAVTANGVKQSSAQETVSENTKPDGDAEIASYLAMTGNDIPVAANEVHLSPGPSPQGRGETEDTVPVVANGAVPVTANGVKQSPGTASASGNTPEQAPLSTQPSPPLWGGAGGEVDFVRHIYPAARHLYETRDGLHPLFVTAQAALETGWKIKATGNNIFGITKGASWTGPVNLLQTTEIFSTPDKQFTPPERIVSVEQIAPDKYRYTVYREFRAYASLEDSLEDHLALLKGSLYSAAWPYRHDPREYARRIAGTYATSPDYARTLVAVIDKVGKMTSFPNTNE